VAVLDDHGHREVVVGDVAAHTVQPRIVVFSQFAELAHQHLAVVGDLVGAVVVDGQAALAGNQEPVLRDGCHEGLRRGVQLVAFAAFEGIGVKHLQLLLGVDLPAVIRLTIGDVAVVAMPGKLEAFPEIHHVHDVVDRIGRFDHAPVDQHLAAEQIEAGDRPGHDLDPGLARPVTDLFGRHRLFNLLQQAGVAIKTVEIGEQDIGRDREDLRLLYRARGAQPVGFVGILLDQVVGLEQLRVGELDVGHDEFLGFSALPVVSPVSADSWYGRGRPAYPAPPRDRRQTRAEVSRPCS